MVGPMRKARISLGALAAVAGVATVLAVGSGPSSAATSTPWTLPSIKHVFVIVLENKEFGEWYTAGRTVAPYLSETLPSEGAVAVNYYGVGHDSLDNYIAMISGQPPTTDTKNDCSDPLTDVSASANSQGVALGNGCVYPASYPTVADELVKEGYSWRAYEQNIPSPCSLDSGGADGYARKHNPFVFFMSLRDDGQCQQNDVSLDQLPADLASASKTPNYVYITPDQCHDAHSDCVNPNANDAQQELDEMQEANGFLQQWVPQITSSPAFKQNGLLAILFDEGDDNLSCCGEDANDPDGSLAGSEDGAPGIGGGQTGAIFLSPYIKGGTVSYDDYNHYSFLRTVEDLFGAKRLANAQGSSLRDLGPDIFTDYVPQAPVTTTTTTTGTGTSGTSTGPGGTTTGPGGTTTGPGGTTTGPGGTTTGPGGTTTGPGGTPITGPGGLPLGRAKLPVSCPSIRANVKSLKVAGLKSGALTLSGRSIEKRCAANPKSSRVVAVFVAIGLRTHGRCRFWGRSGRLGRAVSCGRPVYLLASGTGSWRLKLRRRVPAGSYVMLAAALDATGRDSSIASLKFRVR
jgi:phosphatidylinositol-3-phosphatase